MSFYELAEGLSVTW